MTVHKACGGLKINKPFEIGKDLLYKGICLAKKNLLNVNLLAPKLECVLC